MVNYRSPIFKALAMSLNINIIINEMNNLGLDTVISSGRLSILWSLAMLQISVEGAYAEIGVWQGGSSFILSNALKYMRVDTPIFSFDTFEGILWEWENDGDKCLLGRFSNADYLKVKNILEKYYDHITVIKGFVPTVLNNFAEYTYSLVHVDTDTYQSVYDCCAYFWPRLNVKGIMIFDDYAFPKCKGAKIAVDKFFRDKKEVIKILPSRQAVVRKCL